MLRGTLLYFSEQPSMRRIMSGRLARPLVRRFVAGEDLSDAMEAVKRLNDSGAMVTLDYLGESVRSAPEAGAAAAEYVAILHSIDRQQLNANASLKLTQMGLDLD